MAEQTGNSEVQQSSVATDQRSPLMRGAGVLMPISSLPGPFGFGTLGTQAYLFADMIKEMGFRYWQVLPVGPTSYGDSPYQSFSAFAGNPYMIDLQQLVTEQLLTEDELATTLWGSDAGDIDYGLLFERRYPLLRSAYTRSKHRETEAYTRFCEDNAFWLHDYCLFMALKGRFGSTSWQDWDAPIKMREPEAIRHYEAELADDIAFWEFCQFKFRQQWSMLKDYVNEKGISIIGDIPLYMALDNADVWTHFELFELDAERNELSVAGVPPDLFSATGQRWGNPLYRWDVIEQTDFEWWKQRMSANAKLYDVIRIDHFIGIVNYWSIPADCPTAMEGKWCPGPGEKLTRAIDSSIGKAKIIAEDLGVLTEPVKQLIRKEAYPGMKVIEFGLSGEADNEYLPHNYVTDNVVTYVGTHDNETLLGFLLNDSTHIEWMKEYFCADTIPDLHRAIIRAAFASTSRVCVVQMQDILMLDNHARMNMPSSVGTNWRWRMTQAQTDTIPISYYRRLIELYNR